MTPELIALARLAAEDKSALPVLGDYILESGVFWLEAAKLTVFCGRHMFLPTPWRTNALPMWWSKPHSDEYFQKRWFHRASRPTPRLARGILQAESDRVSAKDVLGPKLQVHWTGGDMIDTWPPQTVVSPEERERIVHALEVMFEQQPKAQVIEFTMNLPKKEKKCPRPFNNTPRNLRVKQSRGSMPRSSARTTR